MLNLFQPSTLCSLICVTIPNTIGFCLFQDHSEEELAEMPSCNLAETIHNKSKQQSTYRGNDLFVAIIDDYVRAFMQCVAYYQYLGGHRAGTGPSKEELWLKAAQKSAMRIGSSKSLLDTLSKMLGAEEFCTRTPHLEGEEGFVSLKRKADIPLGL